MVALWDLKVLDREYKNSSPDFWQIYGGLIRKKGSHVVRTLGQLRRG